MRSPSAVRTFLVVVVVGALLAAACGDSGGELADLAGDAAPTDAADSGPIEPAEVGDNSAYCAIAEVQRADARATDPFAVSPEELERYFGDTLERVDAAIPVSPPEIRDDLEQMREQTRALVDDLAAADWDILAVVDQLEALAEDPDYNAPSDRVLDYDLDVCGIATSSDSEEPPDPTSTTTPTTSTTITSTTITGNTPPPSAAGNAEDPFASPDALEAVLGTEFGRRAFAEGMAESGDISIEQATCLVDNLDFATLFALGGGQGRPTAEDAAGLFEAFDACGITPDQLLG